MRIPLDIVVTATGTVTGGVIVAVMASELDALESQLAEAREALREAEKVVASIERFGTYLDPRHYGDKYDHHTFTRCVTEEGKWVAVYRLDDEALTAYLARAATDGAEG